MQFEGIAIAESVWRWRFGTWRTGNGYIWLHAGPIAFGFSKEETR